jgi:hypothetical protein
MMSARQLWIFFRCTRWLLWLATLGYSIEFMMSRRHHMDEFGRLYLSTEFWMYFLPLAAVFAGSFELMMRGKAGITRNRLEAIASLHDFPFPMRSACPCLN